MRFGSLSLGAKLNLALLVFVLTLGVASSAVVLYGFNRTQDNATERSRQALEAEGELALEALAGGLSDSGSLQFESAAEVGQRAARYLEEFRSSGATPQYDTSRFVRTDNGIWYDPDPARRSDIVVLNHGELEGAPLDDIAYSAALDPILPALAEGFPGQLSGEAYNPIAIIYIGVSGVGRYYPPIGIQETTPPEVDVSDFYDRFGPVANPERETVWTTPYEDLNGRGLVITAQTPVYYGDEFRGIFEVDLSISKLVDLVNDLKPTPGGFTFYVDTGGGILETDSFEFLNAEALENESLAAILEAMKAPPSGESSVAVDKVTLDGREYYIAHTPMAMPGGSVGVAAPVDEVTGEAALITASVEEEADRTFAIILAAMGALFVVGLVAATYLNRRVIVGPIRQLAEATRSVAGGDLDTRVQFDRSDELGTLGASFNQMVEQLRESERLLERRVEERTREVEALLGISQTIASTLDVGKVLGTILDQLGAITEHTGSAILLTRDDDFEVVEARSVTGSRAETGARIPFANASVLAQAMRLGETVIIDDVRADEQLAADYRAAISAIGLLDQPPFNVIRSWMAVPLALQDRVLGALTISWTEPSYFTQDHARLARAFADQAAIAIENARLFDETGQRARELAALLDTSKALASTLDLRQLLELILDQLPAFVDYAGASVNLLQDGMFHQLAVRRPRGPAVTEQDKKLILPRNVYEDLGFSVEASDLLLIDDVHGDSPEAHAYRQMYGGSIKGTSVEYIHSFMNLPLVARGKVVGVLSVAHEKPGYLRVEHAELLRPLADQAAVAIENARLFDETERRARESQALFSADEELFRSLDLDTVLRALVDVTVDVVRADKSMVSTWDADAGMMSLRAWRNLGEPTLAYIRGLFDRRTQRMEAQNYDDSLAAVIVTDDPTRAPPHLVPIIEAEGIGSMIEVPVFSATGRPLGFFSVAYTTAHHFDEAEQGLLVALAERAAVAISNSELYERAQHVASLEERQRLARELHDSVSQALYGIALGARTARTLLDRDPPQAVEPVDYVLSLAEAGLAEMRALIFELRPESLESEGLVAAIGKQLEAMEARHSIKVDFDRCDEPDLPLETKEAAYRIAQESLTNVVKHAAATSVRLSLTWNDGRFEMTIADDGAGFDPTGSFPGHLGLKSMQERAAKVRGRVRITSKPGAGTRVVASFRS